MEAQKAQEIRIRFLVLLVPFVFRSPLASADHGHGRDHGRDLCPDGPCTDHDPSGARAQYGPGCLPNNLDNIHHLHSGGHTS